VVTKSGTNAIHGALYGYHTDQVLDARPFNLNPHTVGKRPKNLLNNDGVAIGGPIKKDKAFFFGNWDILSQRTNITRNDLIPPMNYRQGDFRSALGAPLFNAAGAPINVCTTEGATVQLQQGMVFDPSTGNQADATGRCVFSSGGALNVIPTNRLNQGAQNFWALLPAPNVPGAFDANTSTNYFVSKTQASTRNIYTGKIDYIWNDHHTITGKYTAQDYNYNNPFDFPQAGGAGDGPNHQLAQTITLGHTWTPSPSVVVTGHVGFTRMSEIGTPNGYGTVSYTHLTLPTICSV